jgi:hypothetical protein
MLGFIQAQAHIYILNLTGKYITQFISHIHPHNKFAKFSHNDKRWATFLRLRWKKPLSGFMQTQKCG